MNQSPAMPDITKAQIIAAIPIIGKLLAAFGVYTLTGAQELALTGALAGGLGIALADAVIRVGRSLGLHGNSHTHTADVTPHNPVALPAEPAPPTPLPTA